MSKNLLMNKWFYRATVHVIYRNLNGGATETETYQIYYITHHNYGFFQNEFKKYITRMIRLQKCLTIAYVDFYDESLGMLD